MLQGRRGKYMKQSVHKKRPVHNKAVHKKSKILKENKEKDNKLTNLM